MPYLRVNNVGLHYQRVGSGEPMLWLAGFAISAAAWDPVLPLYTPHLECLSFDNRSSGRSGPGHGLISIPQLAGDAVGVLDRLGIDSAHVYGISYGGMVAQEMAIRFPDRVRGLVLGGTSPGGPLAFRPTLDELRALGLALKGSPGRYGLAGALFSPEFRRDHPERARELVLNLQNHRAPYRGVLAHLLASVYHDTVSRLGQIKAPTLVMHGGKDAMTPLANARLLAQRIPDAELAIVEGAGHAYPLECPDESAHLLLDFLRRRTPTAGPPRRAPSEPLTRAFGLPVGVARTARSLAELAKQRTT